MIPTLQSLWLVDSVIRNEEAGKIVLAGLFNQIEVAQGTDYTAGAWVFFSVRGVHGVADLNLIYVDLSDDETLLEQPFRVEGGPLETTDVAISTVSTFRTP
jgi:hypothetical protein